MLFLYGSLVMCMREEMSMIGESCAPVFPLVVKFSCEFFPVTVIGGQKRNLLATSLRYFTNAV